MKGEPGSGHAGSRGRRILQAVWSGAAGRLIASGVGLLSLPLAVRYLGGERYGIWATVTTTAVWLNLLDLGVANTLTNEISRSYAVGDRRRAARFFTNALVLTCATAAGAALILAFVIPRIGWTALLSVSSRVNPREVTATITVAVVLMLLGMPCNLASKIFAGYQELHRYNLGVTCGALASLAGLATGVLLGVSMPMLYVMSIGCGTFTAMTLLVVAICQRPWLIPRLNLVDSKSIRELLRSGWSFFLIQVSAVVVFSSDNLVVSHYLGASEVTPYSVTWRVAGVAALLPSLIFPALWPAYAEAHAKSDFSWIRQAFAKTIKNIIVLDFICAAALLLFGRSAIRFWAGAAAVPTLALLSAMCAWILVSGFMSAESCLLAALNRTREQAVLSIVAAAVNVALSIVLVRRIGALGVIGGTLISYLVFLVGPQSIIVRNVWRRELANTARMREQNAGLRVVAAGD